MRQRSPLFHMLIAAAMVLILSQTVLPAPQAPRQAVVSLWAFPTRLLASVEVIAAYMLIQIHDTLTRLDSAGQVQPGLAERWQRSPDGRTWTLSLREAKFQDGQPVTADDVKFSFEFYLHPRYPLPSPPLLEIDGARPFREGRASEVTGIQVVDRRTIRFTLTRRYAFFLDSIAGNPNYILPKHALAGVDMDRMLEHPYHRRPIGAGPFRLVEWRERDSILMEAFPDYWGGRPSLDRLIFRFIPEPATVAAELRAGNLDAGTILPDEVDAFQRDQRVQVVRMPGELFYWFAFNHRHPFFGDVRVRQAIAQAIDRDTMIRVLQNNFGRIANSPVHPSRWQHNARLNGWKYDPDAARSLLREAGFSAGPGGVLQREGRPFRVRYSFLSEKRYQDQALMIQQFLRRVGIETTLEVHERGAWFGQVFTPTNAANLDLVGLSFYNLWLPQQSALDVLFGSNGFWTRIAQYQNSEIDAILDQLNTATDRSVQRTLYFRLQDLVIQDVPRVLTFYPDDLLAVRRSFVVPKVNTMPEFFRSIPTWRAAP